VSVFVGRQSRLRFADLLQQDGREFFDMLELPPLDPQVDDLQYEVQSNDRLDLLAHRFYDSAELQYVIAHANDIELWPTQVRVGSTLRIPAPRYVLQVWLNLARPRVR
jgi:nucleoid-associated protein YgaU